MVIIEIYKIQQRMTSERIEVITSNTVAEAKKTSEATAYTQWKHHNPKSWIYIIYVILANSDFENFADEVINSERQIRNLLCCSHVSCIMSMPLYGTNTFLFQNKHKNQNNDDIQNYFKICSHSVMFIQFFVWNKQFRYWAWRMAYGDGSNGPIFVLLNEILIFSFRFISFCFAVVVWFFFFLFILISWLPENSWSKTKNKMFELFFSFFGRFRCIISDHFYGLLQVINIQS